MDHPALATTEQVAAYLGDDFPAKTLAEWRSRGIGPRYLKVGRHVRYRWADVETWLASKQVDPRLIGA
jgi:predicted DNA-binding transcriptional regulator AlpA